jgi:hypothetical protein
MKMKVLSVLIGMTMFVCVMAARAIDNNSSASRAAEKILGEIGEKRSSDKAESPCSRASKSTFTPAHGKKKKSHNSSALASGSLEPILVTETMKKKLRELDMPRSYDTKQKK